MIFMGAWVSLSDRETQGRSTASSCMYGVITWAISWVSDGEGMWESQYYHR